jgi:hypothetical protein
MVSGLRHGVDRPDEELWIIGYQWYGRLDVMVDWWRAHIIAVSCMEYFQRCGWTVDDFSW